jgi:hypothetical protein
MTQYISQIGEISQYPWVYLTTQNWRIPIQIIIDYNAWTGPLICWIVAFSADSCSQVKANRCFGFVTKDRNKITITIFCSHRPLRTAKNWLTFSTTYSLGCWKLYQIPKCWYWIDFVYEICKNMPLWMGWQDTADLCLNVRNPVQLQMEVPLVAIDFLICMMFNPLSARSRQNAHSVCNLMIVHP